MLKFIFDLQSALLVTLVVTLVINILFILDTSKKLQDEPARASSKSHFPQFCLDTCETYISFFYIFGFAIFSLVDIKIFYFTSENWSDLFT